jgi:predicted alpha/beta-fold hydrolase
MIKQSTFKPAWWLPGPHLQTLWPLTRRRRPDPQMREERIELPDGDFLDITWLGHNTGPTVLLLHGLEGSIQSHYAATLMSALNTREFNLVFMHFRGCSGEPNRLPRGYHFGETCDLGFMVDLIGERLKRPLDAVVGFSLGGNVLLKWLGVQAGDCPLKTAIAVSVPFLLSDSATRMNQGLSKYYQAHLMKSMKRSYREKFSHIPSPLSVDVGQLQSFWAFDEQITAPLHGFAGAEEYYAKSSSRQYLGRIAVPTLILHARDDPFMWPDTVPADTELSNTVTLELSDHGGHVGFVSGALPWRPHYWLEQRIIEHLESMLS